MSTSKLRILVVDDEAAMREVLEMRLTERGFDVHLAEDAAAAERLASEIQPHAVISDVALPDASGLDLLARLKAGDSHRPILMITAYGTVDSAVEAMKQGAMDFLTKPLDYDKLDAALESACQEIARRSNSRRLEAKLDDDGGLGLLVGVSLPMQEVYKVLETLAASDALAIISGESGTGKELAAQTIHLLGRRSKRPFIAVNTAAIAEGITESELFGHEKGAFTGAIGARAGYFEMAHQGTLFLDEVAEMPIAMQTKLLRVVEDGKVRRVGGRREADIDVRVLAATNRDPLVAVKEGKLREDLFYRLSVFAVELPPLRDRVSDIPLLSQHFVRTLNDKHSAAVEGVRAEAIEALKTYSWPGNVRELRNVIERAVILANRDWIETVHLPPFLRSGHAPDNDGIVVPVGSTVAEAEKLLILDTLKKMGNNKTRAAKTLGIDVRTIRYKLRSYSDEE